MLFCFFFFFKQKTAYEIRKGDWSSDVCSSDLISSWAQKLWQFFHGRRWTICWSRNTQAVFLPFLRGAQSQPVVCEEDISCYGNAQTSTSSMFAGTCQPGCENWPKTSGTPSC